MSAVDFQPVLKSLYQYHGDYFDEEAPNELICPIDSDLIQEPLAVNCRACHVFEQGAIEKWLTQNKSCPIDRDPVTTTYRNRPFETNMKSWAAHHLVRPIEPAQVAKNLLSCGSVSDRVNASANLRFIRIADLTGEVARIMIEMVAAEREQAKSPKEHQKSERERFAHLQKLIKSRNFYGEEGVLNDIVQEASSVLQVQLSPRSARLVRAFEDRTKEYMQALDGRVGASEKRIMEALNERMMEALEKLKEANIRAEADRERVMATLDQLAGRMGRQEVEVGELKNQMGQFKEQIRQVRDAIQVEEDNYGPLTWTEKLKLVISVIGPVALCALARGCAAYMDNDPNTRFVNAFFNFDFTGIVAGAWRVLQICHAGWAGGRPALHRMSARIAPEQLAMAVITASITYQQSVTNANANWAARQQRETILAQDTTINGLRSNQDFLTRQVENQNNTINGLRTNQTRLTEQLESQNDLIDGLRTNQTRLTERLEVQNARCTAQIEEVETGLRHEFNQELEVVGNQFNEKYEQIQTDLQSNFNGRYEQIQNDLNKRFAQVQRDHGRLEQQVDSRFEQMLADHRQVDDRVKYVEDQTWWVPRCTFQ